MTNGTAGAHPADVYIGAAAVPFRTADYFLPSVCRRDPVRPSLIHGGGLHRYGEKEAESESRRELKEEKLRKRIAKAKNNGNAQ